MINGVPSLTGAPSLTGQLLTGTPGAGKPPGGPIIPVNALQYYVYSQDDPVKAITELVGGVDLLSTVRASNVNARQLNGTVKTFLANFAALISGDGGGVLVQGEAINLQINSNVSPTSTADLDTSSGTATISIVDMASEGLDSSIFGVSGDNGLIYKIDNSGQASDSIVSIVGVVGTGGAQFHFSAVGVSVGGLCEIGLKFSLDNPQAFNTTMGSVSGSAMSSSASNRVFVKVAIGATLYFKYNQLLAGAIPSSLIKVSGAPATRLADNSTIPADNFPTTDFRLTISFEFRGFTDTFARLFSNDVDSDDGTHIERRGNDTWRLQTRKAGVIENSDSTTLAMTPDSENTVVIEVSGGLGSRIDGGAGFGTYNADMTSVVWANADSRLLRGQSQQSGLNGVVHTILLEPLT